VVLLSYIRKAIACVKDGGITIEILQDLYSTHNILCILLLQITIHPLSIQLDQYFSSGTALCRPLIPMFPGDTGMIVNTASTET
jgi:hypothetical protein